MHRSQQAAFLDCVAPLLESPQVQSMKQWRHHFSITCYEHSLFVSYTAFRLARRFGWDERAAAGRACSTTCTSTIPADRSAHPGNQCFDHPVAALRNAKALCPDLTERRPTPSSPICFPWSAHLPGAGRRRCEPADKTCAIIEVAHLYRTRFIQRLLPAAAPPNRAK